MTGDTQQDKLIAAKNKKDKPAEPGPPGPVGPAGPTGETGDTGDTGDKGDKGDKGIKGNSGTTGTTGAPGTPGTTGQTGAAGQTGSTGSAGPAGSTGAAGPPGTTGSPGSPGATGGIGPAGPPGTPAIPLVENSASLAGNVTMTLANTWYDGPTLSLGIGTWLVFATLTVGRVNKDPTIYGARISTGTVHYASTEASNNLQPHVCSLSMTSPPIVLAAPTVIKVQGAATVAASTIYAAATGNSAGNNASHIRALKIA